MLGLAVSTSNMSSYGAACSRPLQMNDEGVVYWPVLGQQCGAATVHSDPKAGNIWPSCARLLELLSSLPVTLLPAILAKAATGWLDR